MKIVILDPEIPGNTGAIGRLCAGINAELIIVGKPSFELSEKAARRAGLDYWKHLSLKTYTNFENYLKVENPNHFFLFTKRAKTNLFDEIIPQDSHLIFGCESLGLPLEIQKKYDTRTLRIPIFHSEVRSLNLANAVSVAAYCTLYQEHRILVQKSFLNPPTS